MPLFVIILSFIPGIIWLLFYLHEDLHPEPKRLILFTFLMGGAFAFIALAVQLSAKSFLPRGTLLAPFIALLFFALVEEIVKFSAAYYSVNQDAAFDEPVDAMIYTIVAALGFATIENFGVIQGQFAETALMSDAFSIAATRFVGATLLHTLTSAVVGFYWAISIREFQRKRFIALGLVLATILHAAFNYLIIGYGDLTYAVIFVLIISVFILSDFEELKRKAV